MREGPREYGDKWDFVKNLLIEKLWGHEHSWPFKKPVDVVALNLPHYHDAILKPTDLGTIKSKLENDVYFDVQEVIGDITLMLLNCLMYNNHTDDVVIMARNLMDILSAELKRMPKTVPGIEVRLDKTVHCANKKIKVLFGMPIHEPIVEKNDDSSLLTKTSNCFGLDLLSAAADKLSEEKLDFDPNVS